MPIEVVGCAADKKLKLFQSKEEPVESRPCLATPVQASLY